MTDRRCEITTAVGVVLHMGCMCVIMVGGYMLGFDQSSEAVEDITFLQSSASLFREMAST